MRREFKWFVTCCLFICGLVFITTQHFYWGSLFVLLAISVFYRDILGNINFELRWMAESLMDSTIYQHNKDSHRFYILMREYLMKGEIYKGMPIKEIAQFLDNRFQDARNVELKGKVMFWFNKAEKNYNIQLWGYGVDVPMPMLILKIRNHKLAEWKEKTTRDLSF